jgi:hypothetical protein
LNIESWFPIPKEQIEDEVFVKLTPTEKLYYWLVVSEFNLNDGQEFYRADDWFAAALKLSTIKIRTARRKLQALRWLEIVPGRRDKHGRNLTTTYKNVKWAMPPDKESGMQFAKIHRMTFEVLIDEMRDGHFTHEEVVIYVYLRYWFKTTRSEYINLKKSEMKRITGIPKTPEYIKSLHQKFRFSDDESCLFHYVDKYRLMSFSNLESVAFNQDRVLRIRKRIDAAVNALREKEAQKQRQKSKNNGVIFAEDLEDVFRDLYFERYEKKAQLFGQEKVMLKEFGQHYDVELVAKAMRVYMFNHEGKGRNTLSSFLANADTWINRAKKAQ